MGKGIVLIDKYSLSVVSETVWIDLPIFIVGQRLLVLCLLRSNYCVTCSVINNSVSYAECKSIQIETGWSELDISLTRAVVNNTVPEFIMLTHDLWFVTSGIEVEYLVVWGFVDLIEPIWKSILCFPTSIDYCMTSNKHFQGSYNDLRIYSRLCLIRRSENLRVMYDFHCIARLPSTSSCLVLIDTTDTSDSLAFSVINGES
jgi:hypothetical protein